MFVLPFMVNKDV